MKLSKDQKDIIKAINDGSVYDIYSYLEHFNILRCFCIDKSKTDQAFLEKEHGKTYKILKKEVEPFSMQFNPINFSNNFIRNKLEEDDYIEKPATLDYSKTILKREYRDQTYYFDPCDVNGINIATSFPKIIDFLTIWNYLRSEFLILEMPKDIRKEEIGVFFERCNLCHPEIEVKKGESLLSEGQALLLMGSNEPPKRDALQYIDEFLEYNNEMFTICNGYLDKKIIATSEMNLYIKRHFNTKEQLHCFR